MNNFTLFQIIHLDEISLSYLLKVLILLFPIAFFFLRFLFITLCILLLGIISLKKIEIKSKLQQQFNNEHNYE